MDAGNHPGAQNLSNDCNAGQCQTKADGLSHGICRCSQDILPGGTHFTPADDDAIDDNQGDIGPQGFAHLVHVSGQQAVDNRHKSCNGQRKDDNPQMWLEQVTNEADDDVGT